MISPHPGAKQKPWDGRVSRAGERGALFLDISNIPAQDTPSPSPPPQQPLDPFLPLSPSLFLLLTRSHPAHTRPSADAVHSRGCSPAAGSGGGDWGTHVLCVSTAGCREPSARRPGCPVHAPAPSCSAIPSPLTARGEQAGSEKSPAEPLRRGVRSVFGAQLVSGSVGPVQSRGAEHGPPDP